MNTMNTLIDTMRAVVRGVMIGTRHKGT